jgi:hypothetical protein
MSAVYDTSVAASADGSSCASVKRVTIAAPRLLTTESLIYFRLNCCISFDIQTALRACDELISFFELLAIAHSRFFVS